MVKLFLFFSTTRADYLNTFEFMDKLAENLKLKLSLLTTRRLIAHQQTLNLEEFNAAVLPLLPELKEIFSLFLILLNELMVILLIPIMLFVV